MRNKDRKFTRSKSRPNQNVRDTSRGIYPSVKASSKTAMQTKLVLEYLANNPPASRRMIYTALGIECSSMCRIIFDLCAANKVQELPQKRKCALSGVSVYYLELVINE